MELVKKTIAMKEFIINTLLDKWDWVAFIVSLIALIVAIWSLLINKKTLLAQLRTADNTEHNYSSQFALLHNFGRKIWRNLNKTVALLYLINYKTRSGTITTNLSYISPASFFESILSTSEINLDLHINEENYPQWQVTSISGEVSKYYNIVDLKSELEHYKHILYELECEIKDSRINDCTNNLIRSFFSKSIDILRRMDVSLKDFYGSDGELRRVLEREMWDWKIDRYKYRDTQKDEFVKFLHDENLFHTLEEFMDVIGLEKEIDLSVFIESAYKVFLEIMELTHKG